MQKKNFLLSLNILVFIKCLLNTNIFFCEAGAVAQNDEFCARDITAEQEAGAVAQNDEFCARDIAEIP